MIKGISILRPTANADVYQRLAAFFEAMGFAKGAGWNAENSSGASFLAPLGILEVVLGQFPAASDLVIEVASLDTAHQAAARWMKLNGTEAGSARLSEITDTTWKSRLFTVEPEPGFV